MARRGVHPRMVRAAVVILTTFGLSALMGCGKHLYSRDDLTVDLAKHHIDLRWGRLENAAGRVDPTLRGAFLQTWSERLRDVELQEMEVAGVVMVDDDTAEVIVVVTWVDKSSMAVRTVQLPERWVRTEGGWRLATVAELPGT